MSTKNIEILRSLYAEMPFDPLTVRPNLLEEFFDPEIEWTGPREFPDLGATHHGYEGIASYGQAVEARHYLAGADAPVREADELPLIVPSAR
jgi:hypothetical protein